MRLWTDLQSGRTVFKNPMLVANGGEPKKLLQLHAGKPGVVGYKSGRSEDNDQLAHVHLC